MTTTTEKKLRKGQRVLDLTLDQLVTVEELGDDSVTVFGLHSGRRYQARRSMLVTCPTDRDVKRRADSILAAARSYHADGLGPFVPPSVKAHGATFNRWSGDSRRWASAWEYRLTSRPLGRRITVHVWDSTREAEVMLVQGDGRDNDGFRRFASVTIANARDDEIAQAVAMLADFDR